MKRNKFLTALALAACVVTAMPMSANAETIGQASVPPVYGIVTEAERDAVQLMFDADYYAEQNPDLVKAGLLTDEALFQHFIKYGIYEGRACCKEFNVSVYKSAYEDLRKAFGDNIVAYYVHYVAWGKDEGRFATVAAAKRAGIDVYSAADGKLAMKHEEKAPVVETNTSNDSSSSSSNSGDNGSGSQTTNPSSDESASGNDTGETNNGNTSIISHAALNGDITQLATISKSATEAKLAANVDTNYLAGKLYDYTTPQIARSKTNELNWNYVNVNGKYHKLVDYGTAVDPKYVEDTQSCDKGQWAGKTEWYDSTESVRKDVATTSGFDMTQWYTDNEIQYHKRDLYNDAYRVTDPSMETVSGCGWTLKPGYGVFEDGDDTYFFKTNGNRDGINSEIKTTTRIMDGYYITVRRQADAATLVSAKTREGYRVFYDPTSVKGSRDAAEIAGYFNVSNVNEDKYILQIGSDFDVPGTLYGMAVDNTKVRTYERVSVHEACTPDTDNYGLIKDAAGKVIGAYKLAVEGLNTDDVWYCKEDYVYGTDGLYHKTQPDKTKRLATGYTYYGTKKFLTANTDTNSPYYGVYEDIEWEDACYVNTTSYEEEATGKVIVVPDSRLFVIDEVENRYYPIVDNAIKAFKPYDEGEEVEVGQYKDGRYYYIGE